MYSSQERPESRYSELCTRSDRRPYSAMVYSEAAAEAAKVTIDRRRVGRSASASASTVCAVEVDGRVSSCCWRLCIMHQPRPIVLVGTLGGWRRAAARVRADRDEEGRGASREIEAARTGAEPGATECSWSGQLSKRTATALAKARASTAHWWW